MDYRHLRCFLAVADELHFTRAAERLGIAQPHVSQQIKKLERELGVALFERSKRRVALTPAGDAFRTGVLRVMAATDDAVEAARRAARGEVGTLSVGFAGSAGYDVLPRAVRAFRSRWPNVALDLVELTTEGQIRALQRREIDIGLGRPLGEVAPGVTCETLRIERSVVALPDHHPLASRRDLVLTDLAQERWVVFDRTAIHGLFAHFFTVCSEAGFTPVVAQEVGEIPTLINLVAGGVGIAMVPEPVARLRRADVVYRDLGDGGPTVRLAALYRSDAAGAATEQFLGELRDAAGVREAKGAHVGAGTASE